MLTALCQATILTGETIIEGHALMVEDGKILDIVRDNRIAAPARKIAYPDRLLAPGLIDAQVNGGGNRLFNHTPNVETALHIASAHRRYGTTRLLLTCITDRADIVPKAQAAMRSARQTDKSILGLHIEGPHLSNVKRGIHEDIYLRPLIASDIALYARRDDEVILITIAPECVPTEQIKELCARGVIVSLGHSAASPEQTQAALAAGATGFTHLYNGMSGLSARSPGVAGVALDDRDSWCSLIADGYHVTPEMIRIAAHTKPRGKIMLVSDAMPPAASDNPQPFKLYDKVINFDKGHCTDSQGTLAGAAITMIDAVRHCVKIGIEMDEALRMGSTYPAAFLGQPLLGKLLPGYAADVIVVDPQLRIEATWCAGTIVGAT